jgi:hypothetical protein
MQEEAKAGKATTVEEERGGGAPATWIPSGRKEKKRNKR